MKSFETAISLLESLFSTRHDKPAGDQAPVSTRYRHISALRKSGLIFRAGPDEYLPQPAFLRLLERFDHSTILSRMVRPKVKQLSETLHCTAHFGILEGDMVTYVVKESAASDAIFTKEGEQLEAYCSAIGKVLLAHLSEERVEAYLQSGTFPALTQNTATDSTSIRKALEEVKRQRHAVDNAEIDDRLYCISVPVFDGLERSVGALSVSSNTKEFIHARKADVLTHLEQTARRITKVFT